MGAALSGVRGLSAERGSAERGAAERRKLALAAKGACRAAPNAAPRHNAAPRRSPPPRPLVLARSHQSLSPLPR